MMMCVKVIKVLDFNVRIYDYSNSRPVAYPFSHNTDSKKVYIFTYDDYRDYDDCDPIFIYRCNNDTTLMKLIDTFKEDLINYCSAYECQPYGYYYIRCGYVNGIDKEDLK